MSNSAEPVSPYQNFADYLRARPHRAQWRVRSRICAIGDLIAAAAGLTLLTIVALDIVMTWPADKVVLSDHSLVRLSGAIIGPGAVWTIGSALLIFATRNRGRTTEQRTIIQHNSRMIMRAMYPNRRTREALGAAALMCLGITIGGFVAGAAKGETRVLPGPRYEVSSPSIGRGEWTPIPEDQYTLWQARLVRADGMFTLYGLALIAATIGFRQLHRSIRADETLGGSGTPD